MSYSIGGYSVEDLVSMTTEELDALLQTEWADLSEDELEEAKAELDEEISAYKDELDNAADELEDAVDGIDDDAERADAEELLAEVEAELEKADSLEDAVDDEYVDIQEHSIDATDGEDVSISDLDLDGGTYTYSMSSGSTNPFGEDTDEDYLKDEGITNDDGEVISDYNSDGFMNQDDIDAALADRDSTLDAQNVFIKTDSSQHWTLVSSDNGTYTFKVEDTSTDPATYAYVTFENAADIVFYFSSGITEADLETMKTTWPTDLLKNCYWADSTDSFYDELFEDESEESNLDVISGYNDSVEGLTSSTISQYTDGTLSSELQTSAEEALEALYGYIDDPSGDSVAEIWTDLFAAWDSAGLSEADQALLIQYLTLTVATNDSANFGTLFGPAIVTLETMLDYDSASHANYNENDKLVVMLLETQTGAVGNYGGSTAFWTTALSADGETQGSWHDQDENITAINNYKAVVAAAGMSLTGYEATALENEEAMQEAEGEAKEEGGTVTYDSSAAEKMASHVSQAGHDFDQAGINENNFTSYLDTLVSEVNSLWESGASVEEIQNAISSYIGGLGGKFQDDVAATVAYLIHKYANDLYKAVYKGNFLDEMIDVIYNGGNIPGAVTTSFLGIGTPSKITFVD
ncbi:MAG: hypothetical protein HYU99_10990 [Deltaproteobacteria bacterium]|nr:hypothetical protein [Deltaproteobacteria bacterium]